MTFPHPFQLCRPVAAIAAGFLLAFCLACSGGGNEHVTYDSIHMSDLVPNTAPALSPQFTLHVQGRGFNTESVVYWNYLAKVTHLVSSTELTAFIDPADIPTSGSIPVRVYTSGWTPEELVFTVTPHAMTVVELNLPANRLAWDGVNGVIYASLPSSAGIGGNSIATLDPVTGGIKSLQYAGSEPNLLAVSSGSQYLYASLDGSYSIKRFTLPGMVPDVELDLGSDRYFGSYWALDLQAAPDAAGTVAVSLGANRGGSPESIGGLAIFDGTTMRGAAIGGTFDGADSYDSIQWGRDSTRIYAANNEDTRFDFYVDGVGPSGPVLLSDTANMFNEFFATIHFDAGDGLIYSDTGQVIDPVTLRHVGSFPLMAHMVPDSALNRAFFIYPAYSSWDENIAIFDQARFTLLDTIAVRSVKGWPINLIRFGADGLAFCTDQGYVYLLYGAALSGAVGQ